MNTFVYKKNKRIKALSAKMTDFSYKKHSHGEYAIGVTTKGIQHYHLDGHLQLSHQNGIMFFNPEQVHDGSAHDETGLEYVMLYFEPSLLLEAIEHKDNIQFSSPIIYNHKVQGHVLRLAEAVFNEENEEVCDDLLFNLANSLTGFERKMNQKQDDSILKMKEEIILSHDLKLDSISKEFGMSKYQFIRYFSSQTGITPYQFFLNTKVEGARALLEKEKDIYQAVHDFNFVDITHLNRQFKKVYGLTAHDYVKQLG